MAILAWIVSTISFLGGLSLLTQTQISHGSAMGAVLMLLSLLACPFFWVGDGATPLLTGKERAISCIALVLALPATFFG